MEAWITEGVRRVRDGELEQMFRTNHRGDKVLAAEGYEFERTCCLEIGAKGHPPKAGQPVVDRGL
jgi:hypothetical protein